MVMNATPGNESSSQMDDVEELSWKMLDNNISEADLRRLELLLQDNAECRQRYLDCAKLHCELNAFFNPASQEQETGMRAPMGMLSQGLTASNPSSLQR
tara:strand:+ start:9410 stop:9706 length:297 start_codon:yes stop_codon:yes gene_type:complete